MTKSTYTYSIALITLGVAGYVVTGAASLTALIPSFFGLVFLFLAWLSSREKARAAAMHIAAGLALLAVLGSFSGLISLFAALAGSELSRPAATVSRSLMALLSMGYLGMAIRSFLAARRDRTGSGQDGASKSG